MIKYKQFYKLVEIAQFRCPMCDNGTLVSAEKEFIKRHTGEYENYREVHGPDPEFSEGRMATIFECSNGKCNESISFVAYGKVLEEYSPDSKGAWDVDYTDIYKPLIFDPPIRIIPIKENYPEFLKKCLTDAFRVFWIDPSSCGNRIRVALEALLTHFGIPRINIKKKTTKSLHERIEIFKKKYPKYNEYVDSLLAIKWLGNNASHSEINHEDVMSAFDILSFVLEEIFDNRAEKIKALSKFIVKSKGKRTSKQKATEPF